jgi:thiol-disulfide isomerase/thioredoxin
MELTAKELQQKRKENRTFAVFFYTPLCGTCKMAGRMLSIVMEMLPSAPLYRANLNLMPQVAKEWQISSVPALLVIRNGVVSEKHYALRSVDHLYQILNTVH